MPFIVNVQCQWTGNKAVSIAAEGSWSVLQLKEKFQVQNNDVDAQNIKIIFQGKEMRNDSLLKEFDLGDHTVIHAVQFTPQSGKSSKTVAGLPSFTWRPSNMLNSPSHNYHGLNVFASLLANQTVTNSPDEGQSSHIIEKWRHQYFVYCKVHCNKICPGKLRVRCLICKDGALELESDPVCWEDVTTAGRVHGRCLNTDCQGDVAEFFFKCAEHLSDPQDSVVILRLICPNRGNIPCVTCLESFSPVLVFSCESSHVMCLNCFGQYCTVRLDEHGFVLSEKAGYSVGCPVGCSDSLIEESHHFRVLSDHDYERYQRFATEECIRQAGGVQCPAPGCGEGVFPGEELKVMCVRPGCNHVFCRDCMESYHEGECLVNATDVNTSSAAGQQYYRSAESAERAQYETASKDTIKKTTKPCPRCKVPVERNGGCMHMGCSQCSYQWCWLCHTEWNRDCQGDHWFG